jgi:hypothetical protein
MAGVGVSADGVENSYEEAIVTKACTRIVATQARVKIHITTQGHKSKRQHKQVDEDDGKNAQIRGTQLSATATKEKIG